MKINEVIGIKPVKNIRQVSNQAIADQSKHQLVKNILAKKMMTQSNIIKPSSDDIQAAAQAASTQIKRADFAHQKAVDQHVRFQERQHRRRSAR